MKLYGYIFLAYLLVAISIAYPQNTNDVTTDGHYKSCGTQKLCVPIYLCKSDEIITEGHVDIFDARSNAVKNSSSSSGLRKRRETETDCGFLEECCTIPDMVAKNPIVSTTPKESTLPKQKTSDSCGIRNPDGVGFRIASEDESEAQFGEFPWMVAILSEAENDEKLKVYACGGSLIAPTIVMTSAFCVQHRKPNKLIVRAGEWDTQSKDEILAHVERRVHDVIVHEKFNDTTLHNDIALLIVDAPFDYEEHVAPICLPPADVNFDLAKCFVSGWGKDKFGADGKYQVLQKKIELPIVSRIQCLNNLRTTRLGYLFNLHESFICAGGVAGKDACTGDGGSPLVCPTGVKADQFYQAGIVSWGIGCGADNIPGVYANVANLRSWIDEKLAKGVGL